MTNCLFRAAGEKRFVGFALRRRGQVSAGVKSRRNLRGICAAFLRDEQNVSAFLARYPVLNKGSRRTYKMVYLAVNKMLDKLVDFYDAEKDNLNSLFFLYNNGKTIKKTIEMKDFLKLVFSELSKRRNWKCFVPRPVKKTNGVRL